MSLCTCPPASGRCLGPVFARNAEAELLVRSLPSWHLSQELTYWKNTRFGKRIQSGHRGIPNASRESKWISVNPDYVPISGPPVHLEPYIPKRGEFEESDPELWSVSEDDEESQPEQPSVPASHLRDKVLKSSLRMDHQGKSRKRTAPDPSNPPKMRSSTAKNAQGTETANGPSEAKKIASTKSTPAPRKGRAPTTPTADLPATPQPAQVMKPARTGKRKAQEAFSSNTEDRVVEMSSTTKKPQKRVRLSKATSITEKLCAQIKDPDERAVVGQKQEEHIDEGDLLVDDDSHVADLLEAEKTLSTKKQPRARGPARPRKRRPSYLEGPPSRAESPEPPMQPFVRDFNPLPSPPYSPVAQIPEISPFERVPSCFRIAEAMRHLASHVTVNEVNMDQTPNANVCRKPLLLEIFAFVNSSEPEAANSGEIKFADLFFPSRPPYLSATLTNNTTVRPETASSASFSEGDMIRIIAEAGPTPAESKQGPPGASHHAKKYHLKILLIEKTTWESVHHLKNILDAELKAKELAAAAAQEPIVEPVASPEPSAQTAASPEAPTEERQEHDSDKEDEEEVV